jgi:hypothetical protein
MISNEEIACGHDRRQTAAPEKFAHGGGEEKSENAVRIWSDAGLMQTQFSLDAGLMQA